MDSFATVLSTNVYKARRFVGMTQDELAANMRALGVPWDRTVVTRIESGERGVKAQELALLVRMLGTDLDALCSWPDPYRITDTAVRFPDRTITANEPVLAREEMADALRAVIGVIGPAGLKPDLITHAKVERHDDATAKAATALGLTGFQTAALARHLWGCSLTEERNRRVEASPSDTRGSLAIRRGHVTRGLQQEMQQALTSTGPESEAPRPPGSEA